MLRLSFDERMSEFEGTKNVFFIDFEWVEIFWNGIVEELSLGLQRIIKKAIGWLFHGDVPQTVVKAHYDI
jgi:hypothetical protein